MSIFNSIMSSIFGEAKAEEASPAAAVSGAAAPSGAASPAPASSGAASAASSAPSGAAAAGAGAAGQVDVGAVLTRLAANNKEKLDWRRSIVDLMKLVGLDSSLSARKELAKELGYSGDMGDSASMNIWLHKQVMQKLADNGGKVPEDLKA